MHSKGSFISKCFQQARIVSEVQSTINLISFLMSIYSNFIKPNPEYRIISWTIKCHLWTNKRLACMWFALNAMCSTCASDHTLITKGKCTKRPVIVLEKTSYVITWPTWRRPVRMSIEQETISIPHAEKWCTPRVRRDQEAAMVLIEVWSQERDFHTHR